jgi:hypothetical protein
VVDTLDRPLIACAGRRRKRVVAAGGGDQLGPLPGSVQMGPGPLKGEAKDTAPTGIARLGGGSLLERGSYGMTHFVPVEMSGVRK